MIQLKIFVYCDNTDCSEALEFPETEKVMAKKYAIENYNWRQVRGGIYCHKCSNDKQVI